MLLLATTLILLSKKDSVSSRKQLLAARTPKPAQSASFGRAAANNCFLEETLPFVSKDGGELVGWAILAQATPFGVLAVSRAAKIRPRPPHPSVRTLFFPTVEFSQGMTGVALSPAGRIGIRSRIEFLILRTLVGIRSRIESATRARSNSGTVAYAVRIVSDRIQQRSKN